VVVRFWIWWLGKMECGDELENMNMNGQRCVSVCEGEVVE